MTNTRQLTITMVMTLLISFAAAFFVFRLLAPTMMSDAPSIMVIDQAAVIDALPESASVDDMSKALAKINALADRYADQGYLVLDKRTVLSAPPELLIQELSVTSTNTPTVEQLQTPTLAAIAPEESNSDGTFYKRLLVVILIVFVAFLIRWRFQEWSRNR